MDSADQKQTYPGSAPPQPSENVVAFTYKPLNNDEIRLIRFCPDSTPSSIRLSLEHVHNYSEPGATKYVAISYCWGDPTRTEVITLDGRSCSITKSLKDALVALQHRGTGTCYWVDALCIDQLNLDERSAQVQQMWKVFHSAKYVIAWLGPEGENTGLVCKVLKRYEYDLHASRHNLDFRVEEVLHQFLDKESTTPPESTKEAIVDGITDLLNRPYFTRTWVIPELQQAREVLVLYGQHTLTIFQLSDFFPIGHGLGMTHIYSTFEHVRKLRDKSLLSRDDFTSVLVSYTFSHCSDPRDIVFASLGDPRILALGKLTYLHADYHMSKEEVLLMVLMQFSELKLRSIHDRTYDHADALCDLVWRLLMGLELNKDSFVRWLDRRVEMVMRTDTPYLWCKIEDGGSFLLCDTNSRGCRCFPEDMFILPTEMSPGMRRLQGRIS